MLLMLPRPALGEYGRSQGIRALALCPYELSRAGCFVRRILSDIDPWLQNAYSYLDSNVRERLLHPLSLYGYGPNVSRVAPIFLAHVSVLRCIARS